MEQSLLVELNCARLVNCEFAVPGGDGELQIYKQEPPRSFLTFSRMVARRRHTDMLACAMRRSEWRQPALVPRGCRVGFDKVG